MRETNIQLVEINHTTLGQWYNKREKKKEQDNLKQGITLPQPQATSSGPLPAAGVLPPTLPQMNFPFPFVFHVQPNTTGMAKGRGLSSVPGIKKPINIQPRPPPIQAATSTNVQSVQLQPSSAYGAVDSASFDNRFQAYYQKRKLEKEEESGVKVRKYQRKEGAVVTCKMCGQNRVAPAHRQYFGNWHCQSTNTETFENWRDELKRTKQYKKKSKE